MMNRREFIQKSTFAGIGFLTGCAVSHKLFNSSSQQRPNIVFIFSDDHAYQAIGAYGGRLAALNPTPNIDRLAKQGMLFDRFFVENSICAPSRATLLTGKFSHCHGKLDNLDKFNHNQQTFPKLLQKAGYQTAIVGKTHLAGKIQGFDYWETLPGQGHYYQPAFNSAKGTKVEQGYVTDIINKKSLNWLENQRDTDKPFMLMVHQKAPHRNWMPALRHLSKYDDVEIPEPENLFDDYSTRGKAAHEQDMTIDKTMRLKEDLKVLGKSEREKHIKEFEETGELPQGAHNEYYRMTPEQRKVWDAAYDPKNEKFVEGQLTSPALKGTPFKGGLSPALKGAPFKGGLSGKELIKWKYQRYMKDYLRCISCVDEGVGEIMDYLSKNDLADNTVVIYCSDQGFYLGEHGWFDKRFMYKESFRTPLIVRWPGMVKPGSINTDLTQNIDLAETFLNIADVAIPADMQGKSLVPILKGETPANWRDSLYYHYYMEEAHGVPPHNGVRTGRYKLINFYKNNEWEFYDLEKDPNEMNNIYNNSVYASEITKMKKELKRLQKYYKVKK